MWQIFIVPQTTQLSLPTPSTCLPVNVFGSDRTPQFHLSFNEAPPPSLTSSSECLCFRTPHFHLSLNETPPPSLTSSSECLCYRTPQFHLSLSEARPPGLTCRTWSTSAWSRCLSAALRLVVECFSSRVSLQFHGPQPAISWRILCCSRNFPEFWWLQPTNVWQNRPHCLAHAVSQMAFGWLFHIV